jgi:hypothetical protein
MLPLPDVVHPSPLPALRAVDFPHLRFFGLHSFASALSFVPPTVLCQREVAHGWDARRGA